MRNINAGKSVDIISEDLNIFEITTTDAVILATTKQRKGFLKR